MGTWHISSVSPLWSSGPPAGYLLATDEIHLWRFTPRQADQAMLNEAEIARAARYHRQEDRDRFVTARDALRRLCAFYLSLPAGEVRFAATRYGKPYLTGPAAGSLQFNISHSGQCILIALARTEVGVDVEQAEPGFHYHDIAVAHFSAGETDHVQQAPDPVNAFYTLWTKKEALAKAIGTGLSTEPRRLLVLDGTVEESAIAGNWLLKSFQPMPGYAAALACTDTAGRLRCFTGD